MSAAPAMEMPAQWFLAAERDRLHRKLGVPPHWMGLYAIKTDQAGTKPACEPQSPHTASWEGPTRLLPSHSDSSVALPGCIFCQATNGGAEMPTGDDDEGLVAFRFMGSGT